ncbi:hypothetical protein [Beijerinckia sp. L45]|uniref:hypothetical protein n=1 Tax=Beijerinckia sp. L45 TaxID=1641855 RepID=UPI00131D1703|nr:hypothetical protein [Beijerinckia sp. L45]
MSEDPHIKTIVETIEREAARRAKEARATYAAEMKVLNASHRTEQRRIEAKEKESLKAAERWRLTAIAAVRPNAPVALSDIRSVKREVGDGADKRVVSLPHVAFLERGEAQR